MKKSRQYDIPTMKSKLNLMQECLNDWKKGELTTGAAWIIMGMIINPQPEPSAKVIAIAHKLAAQDQIKKLWEG